MEPVDIGVLEAAKENIQPLASGRRATTLSAILSTPHAQREAQLLAARKRHRFNIELALEDEEGDPLEAYVHFVYWTLDNYPQGQSAESGLLELLEEATRVLKDYRNGVCRDELKYLKLWSLYASFVEKPTLIFKFLLANNIGTSHAHLYEEYSAVLEREGRGGEADTIFLLGIARQVQPIEHLQIKHTEFQRRMMSAAPLPAPRDLATSARQRTALSSVPSSSSSFSPAGIHAPSLQSNTSSRAASRLQIFTDPVNSGLDNDHYAFFDVGTRVSRVKENIPKVQKAAATTLRHTGLPRRVTSRSSSSNVSKIVPYTGPDCAETVEPEAVLPSPVPKVELPLETRDRPIIPFQDPGSHDPQFDVSSSANVVETIMKPRVMGSQGTFILSEAEALRKAPFKNYMADDEYLRIDSD